MNFMMFFTNFDRFQLYAFHNRTYSKRSLQFILQINYLKQLEMKNIKDIIRKTKDGLLEKIDSLKEYFNFKSQNYDDIEMKKI